MHLCRDASHERSVRYAAGDNASGSDDGIGADRNASEDECPRADPTSLFDSNRTRDEIKRATPIIVAAGAKIGPLRNARMIANFDIRQIVDPSLLANPAMISKDQSPRVLDPHVWFDDNAASDARTKEPQKKALGTTQRKPSTLEDQQADNVPEDADEAAAPGIVCAAGV